MKKYSFLIVLFAGLAVFNSSFALVDPVALLAQAEAVTIEDLGVEDPGLLPTNPFYFFKEWGRAFRRAITVNAISKAELELRIVNEKAAELKKVEELNEGNEAAIENAIRNYRDNQERLKDRFADLEAGSQNPDMEKLLSSLADRVVKHEKLFDSLAQKFSGSQEIKNLTESAKGLLEQAAATAATKDDPKKFAEKFKKALEETRGGELKSAHSVEIIERLKEKANDDIKKELDEIQDDFSDQAGEDVEKLLEEKSVMELEDVLRELPPSQKRTEIGERIFEKQKEELNAKSPMPVAIPLPPQASLKAEIAVCDQIRKNLDEVWDLYKAGRLTEQEYVQKYEVLKKQFAACEAAGQVVPPTTAVPVQSDGAIVCTQQYDPVCGVNGKTYSNECVAKGSGILVQYKGECKLPEKSTIVPSESAPIKASDGINY